MTLLGLICGLGSAIAFALINILTRALLGRGYTGKAVNFWNDKPVKIKAGRIAVELAPRSCLFAVVR